MQNKTTDPSSNNHIIRKAKFSDDMKAITSVFDAARKIMKDSGNTNQWKAGYPSEDVISADIKQGGGYVIEESGKIIAYFAFLPSPEPTYSKIYGGQWLDDSIPYHVIHRIASYPHIHGIFREIMNFCKEKDKNIRIDTHRDNLIMQHNIIKHGFSYCGIIHLFFGDERLAYQFISDQ